MFTVIAGVIGVIIAIALIAIAINYFTNIFGENAEKSKYAAYQNTGNQIKAAVQFYAVSNGGSFPTGTGDEIIATLEGAVSAQNPNGVKYLRNIPRDQISPTGTVQDWTIVGKYAFTPLADIAQCVKMNKFANMTISGTGAPDVGTANEGCPLCSDLAFDTYPACRNQ